MSNSASGSLNSLAQSLSRSAKGLETRSAALDMTLPISNAGIVPVSDFPTNRGPTQEFPHISIDAGSPLLNRNPSIASRGSHASMNTVHDSGLELTIPRSHHQRSRSDVSAVSVMSYSGSEVVAAEGNSEEPVVFVEAPPRNLLCMVCERVFTDPVIAKCGHTFCRLCVLNMPAGDVCPVHKIQLSKSNIISNLAVSEQINELMIRCKYGCRPVVDAASVGCFEIDPNGCQKSIKLSERKQHEAACEFAPVKCPHSRACGLFCRKDLDVHKGSCNRIPCAHKLRGCAFVGTRADVDEHVRECRFESIKGILAENDQRIDRLTQALDAKEQEIGFLRAMLAKLSERVERMEGGFEMRFDALDDNYTRLTAESREMARSMQEVQREVSSVHAKLGLVDDYDILGASHVFKCKGTFVGHQGPVWALAVHGDLLFSGSSDETIKVWDTATSFKCKKTLNAHRGIVHTLCVHNHMLYSGSSDCVINVWDIDTLQLVTTLEGHDNPVCTLAVAGGLLLSGSLKVVKIWDTHAHKCVGQLTGLNHWVRALVATDRHVYAGSYQSISVWSAQRAELEATDKQQPKKLHVLHTSGGSVYSLCVTDKLIICGTYENLIHVWDLATYTETHTLDGHVGTVYALAVMTQANGKGRLFSASYDRTIKVWSLDQMQCVQTLTRHQNSVDTLVVQRGRLFSGAADSSVKVWQ
eukprot:m.233044 g.233044  ORF g.233044 m.233044 type:complete len:697 (+) comp12450_c0_seq1:87-2177(+)